MSDAPRDQRENLALVRTDLANERTLLAYCRTAVMGAAAGATLIKFFPELPMLQAIAWTFIAAGVGVGVTGTVRFTRLHKRLRQIG
jgi:putative membrane protein